jgi:membrane fusion protein, multidrug efflux system
MTDTSTQPLTAAQIDSSSGQSAHRATASRRTSVSRYLLLTAIVALIVLGIVGTLAFSKYRLIQTAMAGGGWPEQASAVIVTQAVEEDWQPVINTTGSVMATRFVTLQNEVEGTVRELHITSGQIVDEGQLLLRLDTSVETAELQAALARQSLAELRFNRLNRAADLNAVSADELSEARAEFDAAKAVSLQLQAIIDRKTIKSPFKAAIGIVDLQVGQYLEQGAKIASLTGVDDSVFVDFAVPQEMAGRLPIGTPIQLFRMDEPDKPFSSTIVSDDMMLSDRTRTVRTRVRATNTAAMRPGMSVNVQLPASLPQRVVTVRATSIRRAAWGDFVYVVTTDAEGKQRAQQRGITVGPSLGERVVVRKGITAGTDVVADGSFKLAENALIVTTPPGTQPSTQPAAK